MSQLIQLGKVWSKHSRVTDAPFLSGGIMIDGNRIKLLIFEDANYRPEKEGDAKHCYNVLTECSDEEYYRRQTLKKQRDKEKEKQQGKDLENIFE